MTRHADFPFSLLHAMYVAADARTGMIARCDYECCTVEYICRGRGVLEINGRRAELGPDTVYFLHKRSSHRYWPDRSDPWHKIFFVVDGAFMECLLKLYQLDETYFLPHARPLRKFFDEMIWLCQGRGDPALQAAVVFHRFLGECHDLQGGKEGPTIPPVVADLKAFLDESVERKVSLAGYYRGKQLSGASLIRRFRQTFGVSPYEYLMRKRIEEARVMLRHSALSVKEIASRFRFSDQYYFSNYFKRKTGVSPKTFRNRQ